LSVVLAHVLVVGSTEADDGLLALVANVDSYEHGSFRDFGSEIESPQIAAKLGIDLAEDVDVDSVVVLLNGLGAHKLRDDRRISVDLVLESSVQVLLLDVVGHDDEEEVQVFGLLGLMQLVAFGVLATDVLQIVVVNGFLEGLDVRLVGELDNVAIVDVDAKLAVLRKLVEPVVQVLTVRHVLLKAEDGPLLEVDGLLDDGAEDLGVVQRLGSWVLRIGHSLAALGDRLVDLRSLQDSGFDAVWL